MTKRKKGGIIMKKWSVSLTLTVEAVNEKQAGKEFLELLNTGSFDHDSIDIEEEKEYVWFGFSSTKIN